ncbi:hypothetical protein USDA257_c36060 [Sinorhizobium fredii USDA 257]|uniref:Uncharacterized protein n=1 Tax=Sinorhizobium fredii (strain USDA 257) TaxID=1185652 RepID=I3X8F7_SINF2|nr:hypothetical protein USDA257_c36060 [Sinorhizobium fredii USDA 257]
MGDELATVVGQADSAALIALPAIGDDDSGSDHDAAPPKFPTVANLRGNAFGAFAPLS